ncbi:MAG: diguanylate cyclase, partial [Candidatus Schekmanbacteria bacterium]|nr:diguanylate cyclase [Candidatus Schekmanbacteria bacterium]
MKRNINNPSSQQYNFENFTSLSCDMITKLVNRTCFMELFKNLTSQAGTSNQTSVLLLINVDEFRSINDIYGHSVGDELLHRLAVLIQDTVINFDLIKYYTSSASIIGYLGSDEFGVFLPERDKEEGIRLAEEVRQKIEKTHFAGIPISSTVSIGIGIYPEHGSSTSELLTKTDAALYRAKEKKGNCCHLYLSEDRVLEQMHSRLEWKDRIKNALEEDRISPWFQPILSLKDNQIHHY